MVNSYDPYEVKKRVAIGLHATPERKINFFDCVTPKDNQLKYVSQMVKGSIFIYSVLPP